MKTTKINLMTTETAAAVVAAGQPAKSPAGASLNDYVTAEKAIMRYKVALEIVTNGRDSVLARAKTLASARRRNGCGCDNAPDCLCRR